MSLPLATSLGLPFSHLAAVETILTRSTTFLRLLAVTVGWRKGKETSKRLTKVVNR